MLVDLAPDGIFLSDAGGRYVEVNSAGCQLLGRPREEIVGKTVFDFVPAERVAQMRERLADLAATGHQIFEGTLLRPDGSTVDVEIHSRLLADGQRQSVLRDISARKRAERDARDELEALAKLHEVASAFFNDAEPASVLGSILDAAIHIAGADGGSLQRLDASSGHLVLEHHHGFPSAWVQFWQVVPVGVGACGKACADRARVIIEDLRESPLFQGTPALTVQLDAGVLAVQSTPLISRSGALLGVLSTHRKTCGKPSERVLLRLDLLARQAADILDHSEAQERLRRSEAQLRGFLAAMADAVIVIDEGRTIRRWNLGAERAFGYTRAEVVGAPLDLLLPHRHRKAHRAHVATFAKGAPTSRRMDHDAPVGLRKNGEEFPIDATITKYQLDGESVLIVLLRDISEQRREQAEHRMLAAVGGALSSLDFDDALQRLATLLVASLGHFASVFLCEEGGVRRAVTVSREPEDAPIAKNIVDLQAPVYDAVLQAIESRVPVVQEIDPTCYGQLARSPEHLELLRTAKPRGALVVPLLVAGTCVGALASTSRDRPFTDGEVKLVQKVAERCALFVQNASLHRSERLATSARDEALGIVAHDLRNPLNSILLQSQALRTERGRVEPRASELFDGIRRDGLRMSHIIQDLLDVAQLDMVQLKVRPLPVAAAELVAEVVQTHRPEVIARSLELRSVVAPDLPHVLVDSNRMHQVFGNLIDNALKFTESGCVTVGAEPNGDEVTFWVADTGIGISDSELPHLFERFWRGRAKDRDGAGLGLAICKGLVQAHGGRLWVKSQLGVGSTFFFTAKVAQSPAEPRV